MWEGREIEPRGKDDTAVRHKDGMHLISHIPDRSGVLPIVLTVPHSSTAFLRADTRQLNSSCRAVSQIATTAGCFSLRSTEIA